MKITDLPHHVLARLVQFESDTHAAAIAAGDAATAVADARRALTINTADPDTVERAHTELPGLIAQHEAASAHHRHIAHIVAQCRQWLAGLPDDTTLERYAPELPADWRADPKVALANVRQELRTSTTTREALRRVPTPSGDIRSRIAARVAEFAAAPTVKGVGTGDKLKIIWHGAPIAGPDERSCDPLAMLAALFPNQMVALAMASVERDCNTPLPVKERAALSSDARCNNDLRGGWRPGFRRRRVARSDPWRPDCRGKARAKECCMRLRAPVSGSAVGSHPSQRGVLPGARKPSLPGLLRSRPAGCRGRRPAGVFPRGTPAGLI